jgi:hypothetical protein
VHESAEGIEADHTTIAMGPLVPSYASICISIVVRSGLSLIITIEYVYRFLPGPHPLSSRPRSTSVSTVETERSQTFGGRPGTSCEISCSHGGEYEAQNLLGWTDVFLIEC